MGVFPVTSYVCTLSMTSRSVCSSSDDLPVKGVFIGAAKRFGSFHPSRLRLERTLRKLQRFRVSDSSSADSQFADWPQAEHLRQLGFIWGCDYKFTNYQIKKEEKQLVCFVKKKTKQRKLQENKENLPEG